MIRKSLTIIGAAAMVACQPAATGLDELKQQLDSLNQVSAKVKDAIHSVEKEIEELDTTKVKRQVLVTTASVKTEQFAHYFLVHGNVDVEDIAAIVPEAPGEIIKIYVEEGQRVSKGQVLIQLDDAAVRKQLSGVQTQLDLAEKMLTRQQQLWKDKIGSEAQIDQSQAQVDALKAQVAGIKEQLDMYSIQAPFEGVVDEIFVKTGENLNPMAGRPAVRVINLDRVYIKADVSEEYLAVVKEGTEVTVTFDGMDLSIKTPVKRVGSFINPNNRTFKIRLDMNNPGGRLKPNLLAKLRVKDFQQDSALVLPSSMIQQDAQGKDFVYIVNNESGEPLAKQVYISTGMSYEGTTMILDGLTASDLILDKGSRSVTDGVSIKITE